MGLGHAVDKKDSQKQTNNAKLGIPQITGPHAYVIDYYIIESEVRIPTRPPPPPTYCKKYNYRRATRMSVHKSNPTLLACGLQAMAHTTFESCNGNKRGAEFGLHAPTYAHPPTV